jgi:hypothetical protein
VWSAWDRRTQVRLRRSGWLDRPILRRSTLHRNQLRKKFRELIRAQCSAGADTLDHLILAGWGWESFEPPDRDLPAGQQQTGPLAERALTRLGPLAVQLASTLAVP